MIFSSLDFFYLFLPFALIFHYVVGEKIGRRASIIILSVTFYGIWSIPYLCLMLSLIAANYVFAHTIKRSKTQIARKSFLILGIACSLGALGYFKYSYFIVNDVLSMDASFVEGIILPLAISFYTFQQIAFITHVYDKSVTEFDPLTYFSYILFFPQLIAGPIVDYTDVERDLRKPVERNRTIFLSGVALFAIGFFKKTIFADYYSIDSDSFYSSISTQDIGFYEAWYGSFSYTLQLYFDFSGYCDMAIGLGLMFGLQLPINFYSPYKSSSIQEFWRRWHITLGRFLNRHVYRLFGGNRKGFTVELTAGFMTFLLGGIWHGAGFTFILWGALHGAYLVINKLYQKYINLPLGIVAIFITFMAVHLAWIPFRAEGLADTLTVFKAISTPTMLPAEIDITKVLAITSGLIIVFLFPNSLQIIGYQNNTRPLINTDHVRYIFVAGALVSLSILKLILIPHTAFIYYDF
ncbi:MBOAT family O-acyltransferase [Neptuniibacter sp.]|uniref:MBOAT family O-acyltransferase n=1 Tax=Neptuniibacter sp. TaxID=1962643 RepID=UPI003B5A85C0